MWLLRPAMSSFRCCCRPLNSVVVLLMFARLSSRMKLEKSPLIFIESLACTERPVPSSARTSCSLRKYGVPSGSWPLSALLDAAPQRHARAALGLDARLLRLAHAARAALVLDGLLGLRVLDLRRLLAGANLLGLLRFRRVRVGLHPLPDRGRRRPRSIAW